MKNKKGKSLVTHSTFGLIDPPIEISEGKTPDFSVGDITFTDGNGKAIKNAFKPIGNPIDPKSNLAQAMGEILDPLWKPFTIPDGWQKKRASTKWEFKAECPEHDTLRHCICGASFVIEPDRVQALRDWDEFHKPHVAGKPNKTEEKIMHALRIESNMIHVPWTLERRMSGEPFEQGDIWNDSIVARCWASKSVKNNYDVFVVPLAESDEKALWLLSFWNDWRL